MNKLECGGKTVALDDQGFLVNKDEWDEDVAIAIARREGLGSLDKEKLEIIEFMRNYYQKYNAFPILSSVCKTIGEPRNCVNEEFVDPLKAWKIAGLPKLDGIHFVTMDGKKYILEECC